MAPDKKTPRVAAPTSCSSMRAAFCSFPTSAVPGRPAGRPRACSTAIGTIGSRSAAAWPCRLNIGGWPCTYAASPGISLGSTSGPSSGICFGIYAAPVVLLWDRGPIHRRREVRAFVAAHPRLDVHEFPAYAPELNPAEYVWAQTDRALANSAPDNLTQLRRRLDSTARRLRRSQRLLWSASMRPISRGPDELRSFHYLCGTQ
jgi:putative transposase